MRELSVRRHGENIGPTYTATSGDASWAGKSTDQDRPDGEVSGVVKRFKKDEEACPSVTGIGLIKQVQNDAIEYTGIAAHVRGLVVFFGVFVACGLTGIGQLSHLQNCSRV